jgi:predicted NBD/HSP70 family sugar kinase
MTDATDAAAGGWRAGSARPGSLADAVLHLIWAERRISRAEIARRAGLSRSTVSDIASQLLTTRLVVEAGMGASRGGRRPIVLEFQDDACAILGVDLGATHVSVVLTNLRGQVLAWKHRDHPVRTDPEGTRALAAEFCRACLQAASSGQRLIGIGVAVPSPVDPQHPERLSPLAMPAWRGKSGLEGLGAEFKVPLLIDNDANLGALAEHWWGAGQTLRNFAFIKLATGVGMGQLIDGQIYRGSTGVAGEIGHLIVDPRGTQCVCGNRGCLTTLIGSAELVAHTTSLLAEYPDSTLHRTGVTMATIEEAAMADDPLALRVVRTAAEYLGIAVAGLLNLMNPAGVILGGGLSMLGERLLGPMREVVQHRTFVSSVGAAEIRTSELGPRAFAIGAATLVLDAALTDPTLFPTLGPRARSSNAPSPT